MNKSSKSNVSSLDKNITAKQTKKVTNDRTKLSFLNYFDAYKFKREHSSYDREQINQVDLTVDSHQEILEKLATNKENIKIQNYFKTLENNEDLNDLTKETLFDLITELIISNSNILLYGYGSKIPIVHEYIGHFQDEVNGIDGMCYQLLVFNCFKPEITLKYIIAEIQDFLISMLHRWRVTDKELKDLVARQHSYEDKINIIRELCNIYNSKTEHEPKFLLVINNIDSPNFASQQNFEVISLLVNACDFLLLATSDNLYINYHWNQPTKDRFSFYFLKFHSFLKYDCEITNLNSLSGVKDIKLGAGLAEVLKSLTRNQKEVLKLMAQFQLENDVALMTPQHLVDYINDKSYGVCNTQNRFTELIFEPLDHGIVSEKTINKTNKNSFKLNLKKDILEKLANGEYDD